MIAFEIKFINACCNGSRSVVITGNSPAASTVTYEAFGGAGNDAFALNTPHSIQHGGAGNDVLANTSFQFPATLDGGTDTDRCARGTTRDVLSSCEIVP